MTTNPLIWTAFIMCLAVSFVLSGMESGVFALSRLRIRQQMRAGQTSAKVLHDYLENPENFLWTILVGNTVANFLILGWLVAKLHEALGDHRWWFVAVFSVAVFLFYTFFDLLPKMLFRMYPNRLCVLLARPFRFIHLASYLAFVGTALHGLLSGTDSPLWTVRAMYLGTTLVVVFLTAYRVFMSAQAKRQRAALGGRA